MLHAACRNGHMGVVEVILGVNGCEIDAQDSQLCTPLHYSCNKGYRDIVELLLWRSADALLK